MEHMDVIEEGFSAILKRIEKLKMDKAVLAEDVKKNDAQLLKRMAESAAPLIADIGLNMLDHGMKDGKGEIFDSIFYQKKMFVLGKTDPLPYRPDNVEKPVESQFCVLREDGKFFELMYSTEHIIIDSYLNPLLIEEVLDIYGYDVMYMLYRALRDYLKEEEELVKALGRTLEYVFELEERP